MSMTRGALAEAQKKSMARRNKKRMEQFHQKRMAQFNKDYMEKSMKASNLSPAKPKSKLTSAKVKEALKIPSKHRMAPPRKKKRK